MATTWINRGHLYAPHVTPVIVDCSFQVAPGDAAGLGITSGSLKGQGVKNVFMHTTQIPGVNNGVTNPNPAVGYIAIQLADNFSQLYMMNYQMSDTLSGSSITISAGGMTVGQVYVITSLGTSLAADWLTAGVRPGVTPAVGVAFVAAATTAGAGSGTVQAPASAGSALNHVEVCGVASTTLGPIPVGGSPNIGGWVFLQCLAPTNSSTTTLIATAPANLTVMSVSLYLSQSSVKILGE